MLTRDHATALNLRLVVLICFVLFHRTNTRLRAAARYMTIMIQLRIGITKHGIQNKSQRRGFRPVNQKRTLRINGVHRAFLMSTRSSSITHSVEILDG
jgi:hypothetical protein